MPRLDHTCEVLTEWQRRMLQDQAARLRRHEASAVELAIRRPHERDEILQYARDLANYAIELENELFRDNTLRQDYISGVHPDVK